MLNKKMNIKSNIAYHSTLSALCPYQLQMNAFALYYTHQNFLIARLICRHISDVIYTGIRKVAPTRETGGS